MSRLKGEIALVTGAGSGIGRAVAMALSAEECGLVLAGRRVERLEETAIRVDGGEVLWAATNVTDREAVGKLVDQALERFGRIDILVNNAGINTKRRGVGDIAPEDWDQVIGVNLTGVFNCVRAVLPTMQTQRDGLIVNISSMAGKRVSVVGGAAYSASKFGVVSLTHSINAEQWTYGIRACVICPGEVETPILEQRPVPVSEKRRRNILRPEDVAAAVVFVATLPARAVVSEILIEPRVRAM